MRERSEGHEFGVVSGLILLLVGVGFLLANFGVLPRSAYGMWWPGVVVAFGLSHFANAPSPSQIGHGVSITLAGLTVLLVTLELTVLTWRNCWPLFLVAVGLGAIAKGVAAWWVGRKAVPHA